MPCRPGWIWRLSTRPISPLCRNPAEERELCEDLIFNRRPDALAALYRIFRAGRPPCGRGHKGRPDRGMTRKSACTGASCTATKRAWKPISMRSSLPKQRQRSQHHRGQDPEQCAAAGHERSRRPVWRRRADPAVRAAVGRGDEKGGGARGAVPGAPGRHSKGLVVLATVYGDVHDIGKNLVKTILVQQRLQVIDLGKQVPAETIISKAVEEARMRSA
jgi:5-methyltetrahydrofolate--homocysteine methyltransferase